MAIGVVVDWASGLGPFGNAAPEQLSPCSSQGVWSWFKVKRGLDHTHHVFVIVVHRVQP